MGWTRRAAVAALALAASFALASCDGAGGAQARGKYESETDMAIGEPTAPITLIEYASVTCGVCKLFHDSVYPTLKKDYIETGKVRFVFRELPTPPAEIAAAGFQIARCGQATPDQYFSRLDVMFDKQSAILQAAQSGQARQALLQLAQASGLSEQAFDGCLRDEAGYARIEASVKEANEKYQVTGTPTLILNGEKLSNADTLSLDRLKAVLDAKLSGS